MSVSPAADVGRGVAPLPCAGEAVAAVPPLDGVVEVTLAVAEGGAVFANVAPGIRRPAMPCTMLPIDRAIFEKSKPPAMTPGMFVVFGVLAACCSGGCGGLVAVG